MYSLSLDLQVLVAGVAHFTEARHKEIVAPMVGRGVLLDVGEFHKLGEEREKYTERGPAGCLALGSGTWAPQTLCLSKATRNHTSGTVNPRTRLSFSSQSTLRRSEFQILLPFPVYTARPETSGPSEPFPAGWAEDGRDEEMKEAQSLKLLLPFTHRLKGCSKNAKTEQKPTPNYSTPPYRKRLLGNQDKSEI